MKKEKKQYLVIGMGRFGTSVARSLAEMGHEVLAVDGNEDAIEAIAPFVTQAVTADATDENTLRELDAQSFDAAVVSIGSNVRESILISMLCKEAGIPTVIAKANDELHGKILRKVGVDRIVFPEREMGLRLARTLAMPGIVETMELTDEYQVAEVILPTSWAGKTLMTLNVRRNYGLTVVAIRRAGKMIASPGADFAFAQGDMLIVMGKEADIHALEDK